MPKSNDIGKIRQIRAQFPGFCMSCGEQTETGDDVFWCVEVGVWHTDCSAPKDLRFQVKEAKRAHELGLGSAAPTDLSDDYTPPRDV